MMASVHKRRWRHKGQEREAWTVRYFDDRGSRRSKQFALKKEADAFRQRVERELFERRHVAERASAKMAELALAYERMLDRRLKEGTIRDATWTKERSHLRVHVLPRFGAKTVVDLTHDDADAFFTELRDKGFSAETISAIFAALTRMLDFAVRRRWASRNVAREVRAWPENRLPTADRIRTFDVDEAKRLFLYFQNPRAHSPHMRERTAAMGRCIVYLGMFCGMRSGEIRGLPWAAVDFEAGMLQIRQQLDHRRHITPPKTRSSNRVIAAPRVVLEELKAWRRHAVDNSDGLIFTTRQGRGVSPQDLHNHIWKRAMADLGYLSDDPGGRPHFHALRHFATSVLAQHMPIGDVAPYMGHKNVNITLATYTSSTLTRTMRQTAVENMAAALLPAPLAA